MNENKNIELTMDQLDEVAGGAGRKGGKGSRLLETVEDIENCRSFDSSFDSCRYYVERYKRENETKQMAVSELEYLLRQNNYTLYYGVVEAFVDKYWDLV